MKRIAAFIMALLTFLCLAACGQPAEEPTLQPSQRPQYTPSFEELSIDLGLAPRESASCIYTGKGAAVFSVSTDGATARLLVYSSQDEKITASYEISGDCTVSSAMPWEDGILYGMQTGASGNVTWELIFSNGADTRTLDRGSTDSLDDTPRLFEASGVAMYLWHCGDAFGVNKVVNQKTELVLGETAYRLWGNEILSNGTEFCYMAAKEGDDFYTCFIGDAEGNLTKVPVTRYLSDFAICKDYVIWGVTDSSGKFPKQLAVITNLETGESTQLQSHLILKGLWGGAENLCIFAQNVPQCDIYVIDPEAGCMYEIELPEPAGYNQRISFRPLGDGEFFLRYWGGEAPEAFYKLSFS